MLSFSQSVLLFFTLLLSAISVAEINVKNGEYKYSFKNKDLNLTYSSRNLRSKFETNKIGLGWNIVTAKKVLKNRFGFIDTIKTDNNVYYFVYENDFLKQVYKNKKKYFEFEYSKFANLTKIYFQNTLIREVHYDDNFDRVLAIKSNNNCNDKLKYIDKSDYHKIILYAKICDSKILSQKSFEFIQTRSPAGEYVTLEARTLDQQQYTQILYNPKTGAPYAINSTKRKHYHNSHNRYWNRFEAP